MSRYNVAVTGRDRRHLTALGPNFRVAVVGYREDEHEEGNKVAWKPRLSYRYAYFEGDDPATPTNGGFDMLLPGFYDWGTWWQGEIAGEYFVSNSNLISHQVRLHLKPSESVGAGFIGYLFRLDKPAALGPNVTSKDVAFELDGYCDWKLNKAFTVSFVAA